METYSYDVFGEPTIRDANGDEIADSNFGNPYMFTGRRYDPETDNYYYRARYYKPSIGRFLQTDPIGYAGGFNLYAYCGNDPVNWIDPWGLDKQREKELDEIVTRAKATIWEMTGFEYNYCYDYASAIKKRVPDTKHFRLKKVQGKRSKWPYKAPYIIEPPAKATHEFIAVFNENDEVAMFIDPWTAGYPWNLYNFRWIYSK